MQHAAEMSLPAMHTTQGCTGAELLAYETDILSHDSDDFGYMPRGTNGALRHGILHKVK